MNPTNTKPTNESEPKQDERKAGEEQFWTEWWREYAQTWK